jgi:hypothetical protein
MDNDGHCRQDNDGMTEYKMGGIEAGGLLVSCERTQPWKMKSEVSPVLICVFPFLLVSALPSRCWLSSRCLLKVAQLNNASSLSSAVKSPVTGFGLSTIAWELYVTISPTAEGHELSSIQSAHVPGSG